MHQLTTPITTCMRDSPNSATIFLGDMTYGSNRVSAESPSSRPAARNHSKKDFVTL